MYELETLLVAGLTGTATIILAAFAIIQSYSAKTQADAVKTQADVMSEEFKVSHRPWLGIAAKSLEVENDQVFLYYRNYGSTLAVNVLEKGNITKTKPTRESVKDDSSNIAPAPTVNLPKQDRFFIMKIDPQIISDFRSGIGECYYWGVIDYQYGKEIKGQYGIIGKFLTDDKNVLIDEWAF